MSKSISYTGPPVISGDVCVYERIDDDGREEVEIRIVRNLAEEEIDSSCFLKGTLALKTCEVSTNGHFESVVSRMSLDKAAHVHEVLGQILDNPGILSKLKG